MKIEIEVKRGDYRFKKGKQPKLMPAHYGEIEGTKGADGEPIDVFVGAFPENNQVFVFNQYNADGSFDEHKVMLSFFDLADARDTYEMYLRGGNKIAGHVVSLTKAQFDWWLKNGNKKLPLHEQSLPFDPESTDMENFVFDWTNENKAAAKAVYELRQIDNGGDLEEALTAGDLEAEFNNQGMEELLDGAELAAFDALVVKNQKLQRTADIIGKAFNRAGTTLKVAENGITITNPYRQSGVTQVAAIFELTDGQTLTILLHNKDTTPSKIAPDDMLIAWKWLLNRKDVTIAVAKENGKDQVIQTIARRVMLLAEKNSARFAKANQKREERLANIVKQEKDIEILEEKLKNNIQIMKELREQIYAAKNAPKGQTPLPAVDIPTDDDGNSTPKAEDAFGVENPVKEVFGRKIWKEKAVNKTTGEDMVVFAVQAKPDSENYTAFETIEQAERYAETENEKEELKKAEAEAELAAKNQQDEMLNDIGIEYLDSLDAKSRGVAIKQLTKKMDSLGEEFKGKRVYEHIQEALKIEDGGIFGQNNLVIKVEDAGNHLEATHISPDSNSYYNVTVSKYARWYAEKHGVAIYPDYKTYRESVLDKPKNKEVAEGEADNMYSEEVKAALDFAKKLIAGEINKSDFDERALDAKVQSLTLLNGVDSELMVQALEAFSSLI